jgi:diguanylate cyclase (GGDEF)-like protein
VTPDRRKPSGASLILAGLQKSGFDRGSMEKMLRADWASSLAAITGLALCLAIIMTLLPKSAAMPVSVEASVQQTALDQQSAIRQQTASLFVDTALDQAALALKSRATASQTTQTEQRRALQALPSAAVFFVTPDKPVPDVSGQNTILLGNSAIGSLHIEKAHQSLHGNLDGAAALWLNERPYIGTIISLTRFVERGREAIRGRMPKRHALIIAPLEMKWLASPSSEISTADMLAAFKDRAGLKAPVIAPNAVSQQANHAAPEHQWRASALLLGALSIGLCGTLMQLFHARRQAKLSGNAVAMIEANALDRAMRDPLTGLPNRSGFRMRLDRAVEERKGSEPLGVIYIDLDRFKEVNDSFGHDMGDKLLVAVTERLTALCQRKETLARLGGDEFAMIAAGHTDAETVTSLGEAISLELDKPFNLDGTQVNIGGSVGVAISPEDGTDPAELIRRADISMYRSKASGRGQSHRFHSSMEDEVKRRAFLEQELRRAIERDELDVYYQPVMGSDGETFYGVEALMRWRHHVEGPISPAVFIPLAEQGGMIGPISEWMMRKAMTDIQPMAGLSLAMNVSPSQFKNPALVQSVLDIAIETQMEVDRLEVEVTEGVLVDDTETSVKLIEEFRNAGFKVALDDFGTGYASLSYLKRFRFDKLKIDQVFVRNLSIGSGAGAIVHAVVALGRALGLTVQAEGVESLEHHIFLRAAGCHSLQGYYFAKPMPIAELKLFAEKHRTPAMRYMMRA